MRTAVAWGLSGCARSRRSGVRTGPAMDMLWPEESGWSRSPKEGRIGPGGLTQQPKAPVAGGGGIAPESGGLLLDPGSTVGPSSCRLIHSFELTKLGFRSQLVACGTVLFLFYFGGGIVFHKNM